MTDAGEPPVRPDSQTMLEALQKLDVKECLRDMTRAFGQIIYGMTIYEMVRDLNKERAMIERLFVLVVFGDVLGVPILPPYFALRLLPYVVPSMEGWRRSMLRERDLTDLCADEIG